MNLSEIDIKKYPAKTEFNFHDVFVPINKNNIIPIGIDVGYSTTKVYSSFGRHLFPSFPIQITSISPDNVLRYKETDITYEDENGCWFVGDLAKRELENGRIATQPETLYGWQRINSREYLVLLRVGLFLGLVEDIVDGEFVVNKNLEMFVCTGLPEQYLTRDRRALKEKFIGHHTFRITIGKNRPTDVSFNLKEDNIRVISQPLASVWAMSSNNQGKVINGELLDEQFIIFDGGYHTTDTFLNKSGLKGYSTTWENISMHSIHEKTRQSVSKETGGEANYPIYLTDKYLSGNTPGQLIYGVRRGLNIKEYLLSSTELIAKQALDELNTVYNNMNEVNTLICTGGIGKLFYNYFKDHFSLAEIDGVKNPFVHTLKVILAERHDSDDETNNFNAVVANVFGYYAYLIQRLMRDFGEKKAKTKEKDQITKTEKEILVKKLGDEDLSS